MIPEGLRKPKFKRVHSVTIPSYVYKIDFRGNYVWQTWNIEVCRGEGTNDRNVMIGETICDKSHHYRRILV